MRIKARLTLGAGLVAAVAAVLISVTLMVTRDLATVVEAHRVTWQAGQTVARLQAVGYDYLRSGSERALQQWHTGHAELLPLIAGLRGSQATDPGLVARVTADTDRLSAVFEDFVAAADGMVRLSREREDLVRLHFRHLQVELNGLSDDLGRLDQRNSERMVTLKRRLRAVTLSGLILSVLALGSVAFWLNRTVLRPLAHLTATIEGLNIDDLQRRTGIDRNDEVGDLARAFDRLLARLRLTTASRDCLKIEIDARIHAERELKRSNNELEQFAYVASHDLQEPLRTIASFLQLFMRRYGDGLDQTATEYLDFAVDGAQRMKVLIDDLLTFSRVGTRGKPFQPVDLNAVVAQVQSDFASLISDSAVRIEVADLPTRLADHSQMVQLFSNLMMNAMRYQSDAKPLIRIDAWRVDAMQTASPADIDQEPVQADDPVVAQKGWIIRVADNGTGIEPKYFERIFVIFQRLHTRADYPGTGIGLAVCRRIVERHGGRIWVTSEPGNGSQFLFSLPDTPPV